MMNTTTVYYYYPRSSESVRTALVSLAALAAELADARRDERIAIDTMGGFGVGVHQRRQAEAMADILRIERLSGLDGRGAM